jgi:hypothetical protein
MFKEAGFTPDKTIISYCGGGYRASLPFIYAYMMGYRGRCRTLHNREKQIGGFRENFWPRRSFPE